MGKALKTLEALSRYKQMKFTQALLELKEKLELDLGIDLKALIELCEDVHHRAGKECVL